jgi:NAD(P)H-hydrate epimerase
MRRIDRLTIDKYGLSSAVLMERAGLAVALKVLELHRDKRILVLCGGGNNGGDGLVAARELRNRGVKVSAVILSNKNSLSNDCASQCKTALKFGVPVEFRTSLTSKDLHGSVVIDAVFGTGLARPVQGNIAKVFDLVNSSDVPVISVDIPSGISADTGEIMGTALRADGTITFGLPKRGHFLHPGAEYSGRLFVEDIGFPSELLSSEALKVNIIGSQTASTLIPSRYVNSYKGDYGHVLVIAGSRGKTGAALMTARACLRSGAGLVTLAVPESLMDAFQGRVFEEMLFPVPDNGDGMFSSNALEKILLFASEKADVIAVGPGLGVNDDIIVLMRGLVLRSPVPLVIDADGINALAGAKDIFKKAKAPIVLTPHIGEMKRLINHPIGDRINTAVSFAKEAGANLVLKGVPTIIAEPEGSAFINTKGNAGMATAGSGDVLTGIIAAMIGQGLNPAEASALGVYLHGLAGDIGAERVGEHSLIASDIISCIPDAFKKLQGSFNEA